MVSLQDLDHLQRHPHRRPILATFTGGDTHSTQPLTDLKEGSTTITHCTNICCWCLGEWG